MSATFKVGDEVLVSGVVRIDDGGRVIVQFGNGLGDGVSSVPKYLVNLVTRGPEPNPAIPPARGEREMVGWVVREGNERGKGRHMAPSGAWGPARCAERFADAFEAGLATSALDERAVCRVVAVTRARKAGT